MAINATLHLVLAQQLTAIIGCPPLRSRWTPWFSATFSGARHIFCFASTYGFDHLCNYDFKIAGHIIADVSVSTIEAGQLGVEILSVAES